MKKILAAGLVLFMLLSLSCSAFCEQTDQKQLPVGFVRVTTATQIGWLPLPTEGEYTYPLVQILPDGTQATNVVHLLPDGVYMESSTCENQNCVDEGLVTLENRSTRILGNAILCLPNQVSLELFSLAEVLQMTGASLEEEEAR